MEVENPQTVFVTKLGASPRILVMDHFLLFDCFDYSKSQVAEIVGISRVTIEKVWNDLIKEGFLVRTRRIGRADMCRLNKANPFVKAFSEFVSKISWIAAEEEREENLKMAAKTRLPVAVPARRR